MSVDKTIRERLRSVVWQKTEGHCAYCGVFLQPCETDYKKQMVIDHIVPRSRGGIDTVENYYASCPPCNGAKGNRTVDEFRLFASLNLGKALRFFIDTGPYRDMLFLCSRGFFGSMVEHNVPHDVVRPRSKRATNNAFPKQGGASAQYKSLREQSL
jgi:hypothetical protein